MVVQPGLCLTWSETLETDFLTTQFIVLIVFISLQYVDLQFKLIMSQREQQQQHQAGSASSKHSKNGKDGRGLEKGKIVKKKNYPEEEIMCVFDDI